MLSKLTISNFALIDELTVRFEPGLNIITGETGAGKSILLGALSLILGARADISAMRDTTRKCVVEGTFQVDGLRLESFFQTNDLDFDNITILRREITPSGKTRAFINDTPVNLQLLRELTLQLVDIHSQHQNLELGNQQFQLRVVDVVAQSQSFLSDFQQLYARNSRIASSLKAIREKAARAKAELDYHEFQFRQLDEARLAAGEQEELEEERQRLAHSEEIKGALLQVNELLSGDRFPVLSQLKDALNRLDRIRGFLRESEDFYQRLDSAYIELQDLSHETGYLAESIEFNPKRLDLVTERLDLIYSLQQKHQLDSVVKLIALREELSLKISEVSDFEEEISRLEKELDENSQLLKKAAARLSEKRKGVFSHISQKVTDVLKQLGIPHAMFRIDHQFREPFQSTGGDQVQFLFSANKNGTPDEISKIASGGEISRVMLALKTLVSDSRMLPTIIFDEIDAGISGEVALKMGTILKNLSSGIQVINITHLPQVAGKGDHHFKVYKYENETATITSIRKLEEDERVDELANMVGGANPSETARKTAREMLGQAID